MSPGRSPGSICPGARWSGVNCQLHLCVRRTCWYILARVYHDINSFSYVNRRPSKQPLLITLYIAPVVNDLTTGNVSVAEITVVVIQHFSSINWHRGHTWHTVKLNRWFAFQDLNALRHCERSQGPRVFFLWLWNVIVESWALLWAGQVYPIDRKPSVWKFLFVEMKMMRLWRVYFIPRCVRRCHTALGNQGRWSGCIQNSERMLSGYWNKSFLWWIIEAVK